jgi:hypothetical protein
MGLFWKALLALTIAVAAGAQSRRAVDGLIDRVKGLPPEFAADLILHMEVAVSKLPPKERIALYEEAFRMAAHAELATPLQGIDLQPDTRQGLRQKASEGGLDSLSLQYRTMQHIKALDPGRLQRLFREMRPLSLQPQSCQELLRPELSKWAGVINLVYHTAFTADERAKEKDLTFVEEQVRAITSPVQLEALSQILAQADRRLLPRVSAAYDAALTQVRGDWFAYEFSVGKIGLSRRNAAAFRDYVVAHLRGLRCQPPLRKAGELEEVTRFNAFAADQEDLNLQPVSTAKIEPSRADERAKPEELWKSEKSRRLLEELRWLARGDRKLPEWNDRYAGFLKLTDNWSAADEPSPGAYFFMRSRVWLSLVKLAPHGPQRTNAFRSTISWLNSSYADGVVSRSEWWLCAKELLDLAAKEADLLDDVEQFGNPVLSTYAHVDNPRSTMKHGGWAHQP